MIPVVVTGGLCMALARVFGGTFVGDATGTWPWMINEIGNAAMTFVVPVLTAFIAFSIADRPGIAPGLALGFISNAIRAGFLGGIFAGLIVGYLILGIRKYMRFPKSLQGLVPIIVIPFFSTLIVGMLMYGILGKPIASLQDSILVALKNLQGGSRFTLGAIIGGMMGFDMGGPINKTAALFCNGLMAEKVYAPAASMIIGGMTPPLGVALSALLFARKKFTPAEHEAAKAAVETDSPLIVNLAEGHIANHADAAAISFMVREFASRTYVPVALNLDHGKSTESVLHAIRNGFSAVMIDASDRPFEQNVQGTRQIVEMAHSLGITVEGELGHVGEAMNADYEKTGLYTEPKDAKTFVDRTGVDALAVAVGTAHGSYPAGFVPRLDFERLKEIKAATQMPLVLHGGSGTGDENIRRAVECGINKINVCTDTFIACQDALREGVGTDLVSLLQSMEQAAQKTLAHCMRIVKSAGQASHFRCCATNAM